MTGIDGPGSLLNQVGVSALRGLVIAGVAASALAIFRAKSTTQRLLTWTAVLYAALAMLVLPLILPVLPFQLPGVITSAFSQRFSVSDAVQSTRAPYETIASDTVNVRPDRSLRAEPSQKYLAALPSTSTQRPFWSRIHWGDLEVTIYLLIMILLLARLFMGMLLASRLIKRAQRIEDRDLTARLDVLAVRSNGNELPAVAQSELISVPATLGILHPTILLPCGWFEWDSDKLDAVLAHEMSHVARRDCLTQHLSLLHRAIFWFSPLSWWLNHHLIELAEQASDEAALSGGADRNKYARTLLGFFEALHTNPSRIWWQGVSMAKAGSAEQRVEKILAWKGTVTMGLKKSVAVVTIGLAIPVIYLAASAHPVGQETAVAPKAPAAPALATNEVPTPATPAIAPAALAVPANGAVNMARPAPVASPTPIAAAAPALAPLAPATPVAPQSRSVTTSSGHGYSYAYGSDDDQRFVIVSGKTDSLTMSGSGEDARHVEKLRKQISGDFIWFQRDEKSYIVRDQATIDRAKKLWAPQEELGKKQEELGKQQEALGKKQEELGSRMEQVRVGVPDMAAQMDKLKAELKRLSGGATQEQIGKLQSEIGELQSKIGEIQSQAGEQQSKLGEEMGKLGEQQGKLGEQQGELGRQQGELAKEANVKMKAILDEAIKNGTAQPEPQTGDSGTI